MEHQFLDKGKFALLALNNVYVDRLSAAFRLSDGTWAMPGVPVPDLGIWKDWIGSLRIEGLEKANLVLFVEEASDNPEILDDVHHRLGNDLKRFFSLLHLRSGIECESADLLRGSSEQGVARIRQMSQLRRFYQNKGYRREPITKDWLEDTIALRVGVSTIEAQRPEFQRIMLGLNILFDGLRHQTGQDRLHQFVRSLEALILPDIGRTKREFVHRCQTFARAGEDTRALLLEAFAMRSDTEHVNPWDGAVDDPADQRENVCWQRTRQIEQLACETYSRLLRAVGLRDHFRTDTAISAFWKMPDDQRRALWGKPVDIALEPLIQNYERRII
jgi:hypothetical protein